jgi:hypothetical protein
MHDERYNHMKVEIPFSEYLRSSTKDVYLVTAFIHLQSTRPRNLKISISRIFRF